MSPTLRRAKGIAVVIALVMSILSFAPPPAKAGTPTCAEGGTCSVGDIGPGGGKIFYYLEAGFVCGPTLTLRCTYLEAAPTTGTFAWTDAKYLWSPNITDLAGASGSAIGEGYKNTLAMLAQSSTDGYAGKVSRDYRGPNGVSDWYLPSKDELNQLCRWQRGNSVASTDTCTTGTPNSGVGAEGFIVNGYYWSSTENNSTSVWYQYFGAPDTSQTTYSKYSDAAANPMSVRPIRAFASVTRTVACGTGFYTITDGVASDGSTCTGDLVFPSDVIEIANQAFRDRPITGLTLPPNLKTIRYAAFYASSNYPSLVIPDSVTLIEDQAFENAGFTSLTIGNGITTIGHQVFYRNTGTRLASITFGTGLTSIGEAAFLGFGVNKLVIPEGVSALSGRAFDDLSTKTLVLPNSLTSIASDSFVGGSFDVVKYCGSTEAIAKYTFNIPKTCGAIVSFNGNLGSGSMADQSSSASAILPSNTFTRDGYSFTGWNTQADGLGTPYSAAASFPFSTASDTTLYATWLAAPSFVLSASSSTAITGTEISSYTINASAGGAVASYSISPAISNGTLSFNTATGLLSGTPVTAAGPTTYTITATNATSPSATRTYVLTIRALYSSVTGNGTVNCSTSGYFTISENKVTGNTECSGSATVPTGVIEIDRGAFKDNEQITAVRISNTVKRIRIEAFQNTPLLTTVDFDAESSLTDIDGAAFASTGITSIELPDSVTSLSPYLFYNSTALTSIKLPSNISIIVQYLFQSATSLTTVILPESVTIIDTGVFKDATSLSSLIIPSGVTQIYVDAFLNTPALTSYTYCGTLLSDADLVAAGLTGKTRKSCAAPVVYTPPTPVPYLKTLTTPKLRLSLGNLVCTPGTYNAGYTLNGVVQGSATALFSPSSFIYNLLINGVTQTALTQITSVVSATWILPSQASGSLITCSVTVTANGITNSDKSSDNTSSASLALSVQSTSITSANTDYSAQLKANSATYSKALVDVRTLWRKQIDSIRTNYADTLARINASPKSSKMITNKSVALKVMIAAQKKAAADYKASQPAALAAKDAANKAALAARDEAIAKANATYATFIESIGYGVVIP